MNEEWVVFRDGRLWTDRLSSEAECLFRIQECAEKDMVFTEDEYSYRKMTVKEIEKYTKG